MKIESTTESPQYRTGTLTGLTLGEIEQNIPGIAPDTRPSGDKKVTITWRFLAERKLCGIWDYRRSYELRGELSTYGPDAVFVELFGKAYSPF